MRGRFDKARWEALSPLLDGLHEQASGLLTRLWGLPAEIQRVVGSHHQLEVGGTPHPVNALLIVAEGLADGLDAGMTPVDARDRSLDANPPDLFDAACEILGLDGPALEAVRLEADALARTLRAAHAADAR